MPLLRYSLFNKVTAQKRAFSFNQRTCCRNVAMTFKRTRSVRTSLRTLRVRSPLRALRSNDHRHLRCQALKIMGAMSVLGAGQQVNWKSLRRSDCVLTNRHLIACVRACVRACVCICGLEFEDECGSVGLPGWLCVSGGEDSGVDSGRTLPPPATSTATATASACPLTPVWRGTSPRQVPVPMLTTTDRRRGPAC